MSEEDKNMPVDDASNEGTDKAVAGTSSRSFDLSGIPWLILPTLAWLMFTGLATSMLARSLSLWLALPLGLVIGFVVFFIAVAVFGDGPTTLVELNVGSAILLVLGLLLYPTLTQARAKVRAAAAAKARQEHQQQEATKRYPLSCAGITVGVSTDTYVVRRFGKGYFVHEDGFWDSRYFVDAKRKVTLRVDIGADKLIQSLEYQQGDHLPIKSSAAVLRQATTEQLTHREKVQGGIQLGAPALAVLNRYGDSPKTNLLTRGGLLRRVEYEADQNTMKGVRFYRAEFRFRNERLTSVWLYNGE